VHRGARRGAGGRLYVDNRHAKQVPPSVPVYPALQSCSVRSAGVLSSPSRGCTPRSQRSSGTRPAQRPGTALLGPEYPALHWQSVRVSGTHTGRRVAGRLDFAAGNAWNAERQRAGRRVAAFTTCGRHPCQPQTESDRVFDWRTPEPSSSARLAAGAYITRGTRPMASR
jgi:hypothetical protein